MTIGRPNKLLASQYDVMAVKVDTMPLDAVLRVPRITSPGPRWFLTRAKLNNIVLRVWHGENDLVLVRVK